MALILWQSLPTTPIAPASFAAKTPVRPWRTSPWRDPSPVWPEVRSAGERTVQVQIPATFQPAQKHHVILFAQTPGNGRVLGADTKPL